MRILIADDHRIFAEGLKNLLESRHYEVIGIAENGNEAVLKAKELEPDIIFMDIRMPSCDGLEATMLISMKQPNIKIIMLTTSENEDDLFDAIKYGACGYFIKSIDSEKLFDLLDDLNEGNTLVFSGVAEKLLCELESSTENSNSTLTQRQIEILSLVSKGLTYKDISNRLSISERTVKYHIKASIDKVHLQNRQQLLSYATKIGLIK